MHKYFYTLAHTSLEIYSKFYKCVLHIFAFCVYSFSLTRLQPKRVGWRARVRFPCMRIRDISAYAIYMEERMARYTRAHASGVHVKNRTFSY